MAGSWNEDQFWDYFLDDWWTRENFLQETYQGLNHNQQKLLNAAYLAPRGDTGGSYPCEDEDLEQVAQIPRPKPPLPKVSIRAAARDICRYNSTPRRLSSSERQTIRDLDKYLFNRVSRRPEDLPSLVIKAFKDLDTMFFGSYLFGRVYLRWSGYIIMEAIYPGHDNTHLHGLTTGESWGSRIDLCIDTLLLRLGGDSRPQTKELVLTTLLHEMVHAYFQIRCSLADVIPRGHDNAFWCALEAVAIKVEEEFGFSALHEHFDESYSGE